MLTNERFALTKPTLALDVVRQHGWVTIPAGAILRVVAEPHGEGDGMVDVRWEGRPLVMFAIELASHGLEMKDQRVST